MIIETKFNLGVMVKDNVTGLIGRITNVTRHINGCVRYGVQPLVGADGKLPDAYGIDECSLVLLDEPKVEDKPVKTGGPTERIAR